MKMAKQEKVEIMPVDEYIQKVKENAPHIDEDRLRAAFEFGQKFHEGQLRRDGSPFFTHPIAVSLILSEYVPDDDAITAALLHDAIEDTEATRDDVANRFGKSVLKLVDGVTKLATVPFRSKQAVQAESLRKMFIAMSDDPRVILIKLADRLHNMRTLMYMPENRQIDIALETINIYAPVAHRLGIYKIKSELEDLSLKYLDREAYDFLAKKIKQKLEDRQAVIQEYIDQLRAAMDKAGIECEISGRPKNFYSIYRKMKYQHKQFDEIYDITAIRIIVKDEMQLYGALGIVHSMWNFIPGRFKDYVSTPKNNIYRSLHTTLMGKSEPFEIQIRTEEMHREAEYGIAAHWRYKDGSLNKKDELDRKIQWFRQMMELQGDISEAGEFIDAIQNDLLNPEVYVFTPNADVIDLPDGSTPIDFAYRIHTDVGNQAVGAKVDGKAVPLSYILQTGQVVEIRTNRNSGPSRDWLKFVKTSQARQKIRQYFKREHREENIQKGEDILREELKRFGFNHKEILTNSFMEPILEKLSAKSLEDLYNAVGYGGILTSQVIPRIREKVKSLEDEGKEKGEKAENKYIDKRMRDAKHRRVDGGVIVRGMEGIPVRFAMCCTPVPGDDIIGYITRGRGVTIHRADCTNFEKTDDLQDRLIEATWAGYDEGAYTATINVVVENKKGIISEITSTVTNLDMDMEGIFARTHGANDESVVITLTVEISHRNEMDTLISKLKQIPGVINVERHSS